MASLRSRDIVVKYYDMISTFSIRPLIIPFGTIIVSTKEGHNTTVLTPMVTTS